jgi:hypothetical protein
VLSCMSPCEECNEFSHLHVRESVESVPGGLVDLGFGLVLVLLGELLLEVQ